MTAAETEDHHGSHRHLLWSSDDSPNRATVEAIIVPTVRPAVYLEEAARLAAQLECPLVTLHSGKWTSGREAVRRVPPAVDLIAVDVPAPANLRLPDFATARLLRGTRFERRTDTSAKRNVALLFARMVGWKRVVFLDDDIHVGDPDHLRQAAGLLDVYDAVGLSVGGFPDNSVVCHAYREVGGRQQSFVGGGALAVETARTPSFFPNVYNEDWFYLLDEKLLRPLAVTGTVIQRPYDPYRTPERARAEEFGDVLAEGVFWLLDQGGSIGDADLAHWRDFLARRTRFVQHVLHLVGEKSMESGERTRMVEALKAARGRLALITPELCRDYMAAWATDRDMWERHVGGFDTGHSPKSALRLLAGPDKPPLVSHVRGSSSSLEMGRLA